MAATTLTKPGATDNCGTVTVVPDITGPFPVGDTTVTWTATSGSGIPEGQFQEFALYLGPMPDADTFALPTTQTFSDGTSEAWTEQSTGGDKPKFPVPTVTIGKQATGGLLPVLAWTAPGLSVVGLGLGVFAIDRASRRPAGGDPSSDTRALTPDPAVH